MTLRLRVDRHQPPPRAARNVPYKVFCQDESGEIALTFFRAHGEWLSKQLPEGETVMVSGKIDWFNGRASMVHPEAMALEEAGGLPPILRATRRETGPGGTRRRPAPGRVIVGDPRIDRRQGSRSRARVASRSGGRGRVGAWSEAPPVRALAGSRGLASVHRR